MHSIVQNSFCPPNALKYCFDFPEIHFKTKHKKNIINAKKVYYILLMLSTLAIVREIAVVI